MVNYKDTSYVFGYAFPGVEHNRGSRVIPALADDGSVAWEESDGTRPLRIPAKRVIRNVGAAAADASIMEIAQAVARPPVLFADSDFELTVTDARIIILHKAIDSDRSRVAGQIRFPWMRSVEFRPKQSFLNDSEIVIDAIEGFNVDDVPSSKQGTFFHRFTFLFDKNFHPGELAQEIVQRAARYIGSTQDSPRSTALDELQGAPRLPDPPKGEHSAYHLPVYCPFPQGRYGSSDVAPAVEWIEQS
jgi:hypothetical protein